MQSRYYDPETGRFLNADDADYIGASRTDISYNAFAYCENEPINCIDPSGMASSNPVGLIIKLIKLLSKIIVPINTVANISNNAINLSRYSAQIKKMKTITHTVSYTKKYNLYEVFTRAETMKWYFQEYYSIITYSTSVGNWYAIYDAVQNKLRNKSIADLVASCISTIFGAVGIKFATSVVATALSKLSVVACAIGIPVGILYLMASDSAGKIEKNLRNKNKSTIYTFNWVVTYTSQFIGQQKYTSVLEYYCSLAYIMGAVL